MNNNELELMYKVIMYAKFPIADSRIEVSGSLHLMNYLKSIRVSLKIDNQELNLSDYPDYLNEVQKSLNSMNFNSLSKEMKINILNIVVYPFVLDEVLRNELLSRSAP